MVKKSEPSAPPMYPNLDEVQHNTSIFNKQKMKVKLLD